MIILLVLERMRESHSQHKLWISREDMARLNELAMRQGWVSRVGKKAGQMDLQHTLTQVIAAGLQKLAKDK